jgi:epoxyqueuosine reductase
MPEIVIHAGTRATRFALEDWLGAYDLAIDRWERDFKEPRGNLQFHGIDDAALHFSASPKLALPAGYRWSEAELRESNDAKGLLRNLASALGFPLFGVTAPALPQRYTDRFAKWLADGADAEMHFLARTREKRLDPALVQADAKSVIALATPYAPDPPAGPARVARYASVRDYHAVIPPRLAIIKRVLRGLGSERNFVSADTGPVLERAYAERAGIGWIGKNGMLISRTHGSYILLATVWTTLALAPDPPHEEFCGSCDACRPACPTNAITEPGYVDARRCISYWNIEHTGPLPDSMKLEGWLFGCDACQEACPWTRFAASPAIRALAERRDLPGGAEAWAQMDGKALADLIDGTPMRRAGAGGLRRNALRVL